MRRPQSAPPAMAASAPFRVLGMVGRPWNGVSYIRFAQPFEHLAHLGFELVTLGSDLELRRSGGEYAPLPTLLDGVSLVIFPQMIALPVLADGGRVRLVEPVCDEATRRGIRVVHSVDDHLTAIEPHNPGHAAVTGSIENLETLLDRADAFVVTTPALRETLATRSKPVHVLPNCVDPARWTLRPGTASELRVGWTGSSSHLRDLLMVLPAIRRAQRRIPFRFVLQGLIDMPMEDTCREVRRALADLSGARRETAEAFLELAGELRGLDHVHVPFVPVDEFFRVLPGLDLDIGICPLLDTEFNRHKSANKFYEYAVTGTMTLASRVTPYREEVSTTVANDPAAWCDALERHLRDASLRAAELDAQRRFVLAHRDIGTAKHDWARVLRRIADDAAASACRPSRPTPPAVAKPHADARAGVEAVMLTCGEWTYTRQCLDSLEDDLDAGMGLVVVDNASTDETRERLGELAERRPRVHIVPSPVNLGFAAGCNLATLHTSAEHVAYVNNDVVVPKGWLARMLAHLESTPFAGIVGPRSNRVAGQQALEPCPYDPETLEGFEAFAAERAAHHGGRVTFVERVIGFCMLVRREVIERVGGFDPGFGIGNFEDDDFCLRARLAGFDIVQAEDVVVHHFGGRTFAGRGVDRNASVLANWEVFKRKWRLPADRRLDEFYSAGDFVGVRFDPGRHRVPLDTWRPAPLSLEGRRGFGFLLLAGDDPASWSGAAQSFLATFTDDDDVTLLVRVPPNGGARSAVQALHRLGAARTGDPASCPDVVVVDVPLTGTDEARLFASADVVVAPPDGLDERHRSLAAFTERPILHDPDPGSLRAAVAARRRAG